MFWNKKKTEFASNSGKKRYIYSSDLRMEPKYLGRYKWIATCPLCKHDFVFSLRNMNSIRCTYCLAILDFYN
jgi:hypothetical protein